VPTYEYQCKCGNQTTVIRSITAEENKPICAKCAIEMITASVLRAMSNHIISLSLEGKLLPK